MQRSVEAPILRPSLRPHACGMESVMVMMPAFAAPLAEGGQADADTTAFEMAATISARAGR